MIDNFLIELLKERWVSRDELLKLKNSDYIGDLLMTISSDYPLAEEERHYIKANGKMSKGTKMYFKIITKEDYKQWQYARNTVNM